MTATFITSTLNVTGIPLTTGNNDLISVEATGNVYATSGVVISIGALSSFNQVQIEGDVISTSGATAIDVLGQYNFITLDETGSVSTQGTFGIGVNLQGHNNQLYNQGTITAETGVSLGLGQGNQVINDGAIIASYTGVLVNGAFSSLGYLANNGTISGQNQGILLAKGVTTIVNTGTIYGGQSYSQNFEDYQGTGIQMASGASLTLDNSGTVYGDGSGIHLYDGDNYITNSGDISGGAFGIDFNDFGLNDLYPEVLHVDNSGQITGAAAGIRSIGSLILTNSGLIDGGIQLATTAEITNTGLITASGVAISNYEGSFTLTNTGTIGSAFSVGIYLSELSGSAFIVNSGTISGTTGMILSSGYDQVTNTGTIFGDVILNGGDDYFDGRGGTVQGLVIGGTGNDTYLVDDATIAIVEYYQEGYDVVRSSVSFTLDLGSELEELDLLGSAVRGTGNDYANTIWGNAEDNRLSGLYGNDIMFGQVGNDTMTGGADNDTLSGGDDADHLNGSEGNDSLNGDADNDTLTGGAGTDKLNGGAGDDSLAGGASNDTLTGGDGDDILTGGKGRDSLNGGNDEDTFVYTKLADTGTVGGGTADIITGFTTGSDKIDLSAIDAKTGTAANDAFVFLGSGAFTGTAGQLHFVVSGPNIILEGDVTGDGVADFQIQLNGIATISAGDLVL